MKKKAISLIFVTILIFTSFSATAKSDFIISNPIEKNNNYVMPSDGNYNLDEYIDNIKDSEPLDVVLIVEDIENRVIIKDEETDEVSIDLYELALVIEEYNYEGIPITEETSVVDDLINLILTSIQDRLGWVYILIDKTTTVIQEAKAIISLSQSTIQTAVDLYQTAKQVLNLTNYLLQGKIANFTQGWSPGYYINNIQRIIGDLQILLNNIPQLVNLITQTIEDSTELYNYISSNPWEDDVNIYGHAFELKGLEPTGIEGVDISCRNINSVSDSNGEFSFDVSIDDTSDSIPPNSYYGIHKCEVTADRDGEVKSSSIPYVFSGGRIYKDFYFKEKKDDVSKSITRPIFNRFSFFKELFEVFSKFSLINIFIY